MAKIANAMRAMAGGRRTEPLREGRFARGGTSDLGTLLAGDLTAERAIGLLRRAAAGSPEAQADLFDAALERDEDLANAERTRRIALTGLEWELVGADVLGNRSGRIDERAAQRGMELCLEMLDEIDGLDDALGHLASAVGYGCAVVEVEWGKSPRQMSGALWPMRLHVVDHAQVTADGTDPRRIRVVVEGDSMGLPIDEQPPGKFIVHAPRAVGGLPWRAGLMRPSMVGFVEKRYGRRFEMIWLELFGQPFRTTSYPPDYTREQIDGLVAMLRDFGAAGYGVFPQGAEFTLHEAGKQGGSTAPHAAVIARVNEAYSKLWLGQTLTTSVSAAGGSRALGEVHEQVRRDLLQSDVRDEMTTLRRQLLMPFVAYVSGDEAAAPWFRRIIEEPRDIGAELRNVAVAVNELGLEVPARHASELAGVPLVEGADPEAAMPGRRGGGFEFGGDFAPQRDAAALRVVANRRLTELARRRSPIARALGWVATAVLASQGHVFATADAAAAAIGEVRDADEAAARLAGLLSEEQLADLVELERQLLLAGELVGRAGAREKVESRKKGTGNRERGTGNREQGTGNKERGARLVANVAIEFERIPFIRAIERLRDRIGLTPEQFIALDAQARSRAWRVAGVYQMDLLAVIHQALVASVAAGETSRTFRRRLDEQMAADGWVGEDPWHADVVHYQNFVMAHSAGRYREFVESDVRFWKFTAWGDTCPICAPNINRVFRIDDVALQPPLHFWCDCVAEPMFEDEIRPGDAVDSASIDNEALRRARSRPSAFIWDPRSYAALEPLDLSRFPAELRPAFEAFGRQQGWEIAR